MDGQMEIWIPHVAVVHQGQARKTRGSIRVTFIIDHCNDQISDEKQLKGRGLIWAYLSIMVGKAWCRSMRQLGTLGLQSGSRVWTLVPSSLATLLSPVENPHWREGMFPPLLTHKRNSLHRQGNSWSPR